MQWSRLNGPENSCSNVSTAPTLLVETIRRTSQYRRAGLLRPTRVSYLGTGSNNGSSRARDGIPRWSRRPWSMSRLGFRKQTWQNRMEQAFSPTLSKLGGFERKISPAQSSRVAVRWLWRSAVAKKCLSQHNVRTSASEVQRMDPPINSKESSA